MIRLFMALFLMSLAPLAGAAPALARSSPPSWREFPCQSASLPWEPLARRSATSSCWARIDDLCVPRPLWLAWLARSEIHPWCGKILARRKVFSPPENSPGEPGSKHEFFRWQALRIPWRPGASPARSDAIQNLPLRALRRIEETRERCSRLLTRLDPWGIFRSLLLGETASDRPVPFLRTIGFIHLASASGIHLYAVATAWEGFVLLGATLFNVPVRVGLPLARGLALVSWLFAWCLAGARPGMLRPWIVVLARRMALALGFRWRPWAPLALALGLELVAELAVRGGPGGGSSGAFSGGILYALSVGGGLMVIFGSGSSGGRPSGRSFALGLSVGSWILAALWEGLHGRPIALATPVLSLLTIPIFCAAAYPALLGMAALLMLGIVPSSGAHSALNSALGGANRVLGVLIAATLRIPQLWVVPPQALLWGAFLALGLSALPIAPGRRFQGWRQRPGPGLLILLGLGIFRLLASPEWSSRSLACPFFGAFCARAVEQLDVGQGDAALVTGLSDAGTGLIDAGSERALSDSAWITLLARRGIRRLSWIALTHLDEDHSGGVKRLARLLPIRCVVTSAAELQSERGRRYVRELAERGVETGDWSAACVPFPYHAPPIPSGPRVEGPNQNMGAVLVPLASRAIYLSAGDADANEERPIGSWARAWILGHDAGNATRILKISHHGSRTSSCGDFLRAYSPDQAWISVGLGNVYGLPSPGVLLRLKRLGIPVRRTDRDGVLRAGAE